jgi:GNAT superfamily N-acetyltransferase
MSVRPSLRLRPAQAEDRAAVLAFATHTWDWGDYLAEVWDDWLADPTGLFMVGEVAGEIVGVDKLTFVAPGEAFFEGLRIHPAYRGRSYAQAFQAHMLAEAKDQGAHVARLLTAADNTPIHHMAERDGFHRGPALDHWHATALEAGSDALLVPLPPADMPPFRTPHSAFRAPTLCIAHHWHVQAWTLDFWDAQIAAGAVWTTSHGLLGFAPADPGDDTQWLAWLHPTVADEAGLTALLRAARRLATPVRPLQLMLPADPPLAAALRAAGWESDAAHSYLVFEKSPL